MSGIQVTIHEVKAIVNYGNTYDRLQHLVGLQSYGPGVKSINGIELNGVTIYEGMSRDVRSLSMAHFFAFNPYGPYYEWFLFAPLLRERASKHDEPDENNMA